MIDLVEIKRIYIYKGRSDLRMSINGLSRLAQELVPLTEMKNTLFLFYGRSKKNIKILELDNDGWWIYQKKLFAGKYDFPNEEITDISKEELKLLLEGLSIKAYREHKNGRITVNY